MGHRGEEYSLDKGDSKVSDKGNRGIRIGLFGFVKITGIANE
jgi:hypothetical protein